MCLLVCFEVALGLEFRGFGCHLDQFPVYGRAAFAQRLTSYPHEKAETFTTAGCYGGIVMHIGFTGDCGMHGKLIPAAFGQNCPM